MTKEKRHHCRLWPKDAKDDRHQQGAPQHRPVRHDRTAQEQQGRAAGALRRHAPGHAQGGQVPEGQRSVHRAAVEHAHVQPAAVHRRGADGRGLRHHRPRARPGGRGVRGVSRRRLSGPRSRTGFRACPAGG